MAFGKLLVEQGTIRADLAESRLEIEQARLLVLKAAYLMDTVGNKVSRGDFPRWERREPQALLSAPPLPSSEGAAVHALGRGGGSAERHGGQRDAFSWPVWKASRRGFLPLRCSVSTHLGSRSGDCLDQSRGSEDGAPGH